MTTRFRLGQLLIVAVFLAIVLLPIAWQRYREVRARQSVRHNMERLQQALVEFERKRASRGDQESDVE